MPYKLKANVENFEVVDGPLAGRKFRGGEVYQEVPPQDAGRFEEISTPQTAAAAAESASGEGNETETQKGGKRK